MTRTLYSSAFLALGAAALLAGSVFAQQAKKPIEKKKPKDPMRECPNTADQQAKAREFKPGELTAFSIGNNPQEGQYRREMECLLKIEIANVRNSVEDVQKKHTELVKLFPQLEGYQEIVLEDNPGAWRDGVYVNSRRVLAIHYEGQSKIKCVVLDSFTRGIYQSENWTRKVIRLYYPNIHTLEMESVRHNYQLNRTLETAAPEIQLKALRLVYNNLRTALYSMDMQIAAYYDLRNKKNEWQINL
jgi:hypothetical protein